MHSTHNPSPITRNLAAEIYAFSAKERDAETGLSYFGARYYSSDLSIWLSVDPMSDKYPSFSPYTYCANNPVKLVDPDGETVVIPNEEDQTFINKLIDPNSKDYSKEFDDIYKKLERSNHTYTFISREWQAGEKEDGLFKNIDENSSNVYFTKEDNIQINDCSNGASKYRVLFEETYHAYQYEKRRTVVRSCISEAFAWKFSSWAPGTKLTYFDEKSGMWATTLMGRIRNSSIPSIAWGFKFGMPETDTAAGIKGPGLYSDMELGTTSELKMFFPMLKY